MPLHKFLYKVSFTVIDPCLSQAFIKRVSFLVSNLKHINMLAVCFILRLGFEGEKLEVDNIPRHKDTKTGKS